MALSKLRSLHCLEAIRTFPRPAVGLSRYERHCSLPLSSRPYSTSQTSPPQPTKSHRDFYKTFGLPMVKVFLGALFTYQVTYYIWLRLENLEMQTKGDAEIKSLQNQLGTMSADRKPTKPSE